MLDSKKFEDWGGRGVRGGRGVKNMVNFVWGGGVSTPLHAMNN